MKLAQTTSDGRRNITSPWSSFALSKLGKAKIKEMRTVLFTAAKDIVNNIALNEATQELTDLVEKEGFGQKDDAVAVNSES